MCELSLAGNEGCRARTESARSRKAGGLCFLSEFGERVSVVGVLVWVGSIAYTKVGWKEFVCLLRGVNDRSKEGVGGVKQC